MSTGFQHDRQAAPRFMQLHPILMANSRFASYGSRFASYGDSSPWVSYLELAWLVGMGVAAGLITACFDFGLKVPGHAILRGVVPIALGISLVPRRNAGTLLGGGALAGMCLASLAGASFPGSGSATSVTLLGPVLDQVLRLRVPPGPWLYGLFALAGWLSNYMALTVRAVQRFSTVGRIYTTSDSDWLAQSLITYALCGLLAGVMSAAIGFRFRPRISESS